MDTVTRVKETERVREPVEWDSRRICFHGNRDGRYDRYFLNADNLEDAKVGLEMCRRCPSLEPCRLWASQKHLRGKLAGVVGGRWRRLPFQRKRDRDTDVYDLVWLASQEDGLKLGVRRRECYICGKVFEYKQGGRLKYCSKGCQDEVRRDYTRDKFVFCRFCGVEVENTFRGRDRKFCSNQCGNDYWNQKKKEEGYGREK